MKILPLLLFTLSLLTNEVYAQDSYVPFMNEQAAKSYISCAAIYYHGEMLVDEYSPDGHCKIEKDYDGFIEVFTVQLGETETKAMDKLEFQVAFHNKRTNTMRMYSNEIYTSIKLDDLLRDSEMEDTIIILTTDKHYALTHHEIEIERKC